MVVILVFQEVSLRVQAFAEDLFSFVLDAYDGAFPHEGLPAWSAEPHDPFIR
jgi:hypothetical protein